MIDVINLFLSHRCMLCVKVLTAMCMGGYTGYSMHYTNANVILVFYVQDIIIKM